MSQSKDGTSVESSDSGIPFFRRASISRNAGSTNHGLFRFVLPALLEGPGFL